MTFEIFQYYALTATIIINAIVLLILCFVIPKQIRQAFQQGLRSGALVSKDDIIRSIVGEIEVDIEAKKERIKKGPDQPGTEFTS